MPSFPMAAGGGPTGFGGMNMDYEQVSSMMNNPMIQSMMDQMLSNPEMLNSMIQSNPMLS